MLLLVEDSEDDAGFVMQALQRAGVDARYERVESNAAMQEALQRQPWDAVISDFNMPGFTGLDALRILQATGLDIPFILISGAVGEETAVDAMKAGASDYVMKENLTRLAPALERELKDAAMRAENRRAQRNLVESEERFRHLSSMSSEMRLQASAALESSERRFAKAFRSSPLAVVLSRLADGRVLDMNDAACQLFGRARQETVGRITTELGFWVDPGERERVVEALRRAGAVHGFEHRIRQKSGAIRVVQNWLELIELEGEACVVGSLLDVTEARRATEALRESEARFRDLVSVSSDWYWEQDEQFRFVDMTAMPSGSSPFRASDYAGKPRWEAHADCLTPQQWAAHRRQVEAHELFRDLEYARPSQDGNTRWVSISGRPMFDDNGRFRGYRGVGKDITERVQMQEQLRKLNAELEVRVVHRTTDLQDALSDLERFNSAVSHDLRGPARRMAAFAGLLREELGPQTGAEALRLLAVIEHNAEEMSVMVEQLLKLARLSHQALDVGIVDMATLARDAWESLDESLLRQRVELRIGNLSVQRADRVLVKQVFINLLGNAVKFSAGCDSPLVEVGSRNESGEAAYFVRDNGAGFDMAHAGKLFKPFSRLHGRNEFEGTGIGLSIVEQIARRHGGRVWAEGAPGRGATIYFTLGGATAAVPAETQAAAPKAALTRRQSEVLALLASGCSTKEIAYRLGLSAKTIETHRARLVARLGIRSVAGLVRYALRHRLGVPDTRATQEGPP